jgi:NAD(P)-dependent dehydrogenase (short-subunit alcohol dehydrogenase family)
MNFSGKNVFVAGGTSGINLAIAEAFAADGARVAVLSRNAEKVEAARLNLQALGGEVLGFAADVRDFAAVEQALSDTAKTWGTIDVVISGAAGNFVAAASEMSANAFKTVIDIDLLGTFNVLRAAWPHLTKPGASLLSITAAQSWLPTPGQAHVGAAKAGIDQLTRTLAIEWGKAGVRINAIAPGPIEETEGMDRLAPTPEAHRAWTEAVPLGRFGKKDDIARAAKWLCSPDASYVTGVVLPVDGGLALGGSSAIGQAMTAS